MSYSRAFKWFVILLLPLTLAWKVTARINGPIGLAESDTHQQVADFLVRQRFNVSRVGSDETLLIRATVPGCQMLVANSSPIAWDRDVVSRYATPQDQVFVAFAGRLYSQQPTWLTVPDFLWFRLQRELGLQVQRKPILTVIANPTCNAERLPWGELR